MECEGVQVSDTPDEDPSKRWWVLTLMLVMVPAAIFGGWEVLEHRVLAHRLDMPTLHLLHILRGLGASLILAGLVTWYLVRERLPVFPSKRSWDDGSRLLDRQERLRRHVRWFVHMRWLAVGVVLALSVIAVKIANLLPDAILVPLLVWCGILMVANVLFSRWMWRSAHLERQIITQAVVDLVILTGLLNASGGLENPLYIAYLFHVIIPGILLPRRKAFAVTIVACTLFGLLAFGEFPHVLPHYTNVLFPHGGHAAAGADHEGEAGEAADAPDHLVFVAGRGLPFVFVLGLTAYLTTMVAERLRRSEEDLERAARTAVLERKRLESVVHAAGVGIMLISPGIEVLWFSQRAGEWLQWDGDVLGRRCPLDRPVGGCAECIVARTVRGRERLESERTVPAGGGALRHFRHVTSPVLDADGRVMQVVELVEDITMRKVMEARALHAGKLSVLGRMAAGIAHEIGNPLSSLTARLNLMERRPEPEFLRHSLGVLRGQISRIGRIVRGVSQFGRSRTSPWSVWEVTPVVDEAINIVRLDRRAKGIVFRTHFDRPSPRIRGVKDQMVQIFLNLLLNAVEAMHGGGTITVEVRQNGRVVETAIADTGCGMDETVRNRLFEPFFTTKSEGTGLGLSISYSLVHAHDGRIEVESQPGKGSRFVVSLPVAELEEPLASADGSGER